jgi:SAM-dependent methyltransferase
VPAPPRRLIFGQVAELYDAARPSYPEALVDDLVMWAGETDGPARALEVGAGTGKATRLLAGRGVRVLAIEPSAEMAAIARRTTADTGLVEIVESDFETAPLGDRRFPLVFAAQAWHWVAQPAGDRRAREALDPGGRLVVFWNRPDWARAPLREELAAVYASVAPEVAADGPMHPAGRAQLDHGDGWRRAKAQAGFDATEVRRYEWAIEYTSAEYVDLLATMSEIQLLAPDRRAVLLDAIAARLDANGGRMTLPMFVRAGIARAV